VTDSCFKLSVSLEKPDDSLAILASVASSLDGKRAKQSDSRPLIPAHIARVYIFGQHRWLAYYHLVRPHLWLRLKIRGPSRCRHWTPAMAAALTRRRWSVAQLLLNPIPKGVHLDAFPLA